MGYIHIIYTAYTEVHRRYDKPPYIHHPVSPIINSWTIFSIHSPPILPFILFEANPKQHIISFLIFHYVSLKNKDSLINYNCNAIIIPKNSLILSNTSCLYFESNMVRSSTLIYTYYSCFHTFMAPFFIFTFL